MTTRTSSPPAPAISVRQLSVHYDGVVALDNVGFTLERGQVCGLIGVNGSGKSTLFKSLMGLVAPQRGTVTLFDRAHAAARKEKLVAYVPQSEDVDWNFPVSVGDVVLMGRYAHMGPARRASRADRSAVDHALDRVGLADLRHRQIGELSGGQKKRTFVARGIAQDAQLLLLDEPFAGVDKASEATLVTLLRELKEEGRTVLVSTHDLAGIPQLCDRAILLHHSILAEGIPAAVLTHENLARAFGTAGSAAVVPASERQGA
ncbi:manganese transport system ATP-binding protein [Arthrobacter pigmenti]|uniref:Manganese transport system ATP-binding protein n=1 Tax=Arthrobacter pigmenti TaxID=271432 RepID=A0A846RHY8_9MICC|nr:metal ABC transporter ATP-binding protein [Arthrobacter pigmenti]NJC22878.1 manganese transport system ATP-binding protein [Arthrobacter pigmenti]